MLQIFFMRLICWSCFSLFSLISISGKSWIFPSGLWFIFSWLRRDFDCAGAWSGGCSCLHNVVLTAGVNSLQSEAELSQPPCQGAFPLLCLQHECGGFGCFLLWTTQAPQVLIQDKVSCFF